jgi:hypothetical protein
MIEYGMLGALMVLLAVVVYFLQSAASELESIHQSIKYSAEKLGQIDNSLGRINDRLGSIDVNVGLIQSDASKIQIDTSGIGESVGKFALERKIENLYNK